MDRIAAFVGVRPPALAGVVAVEGEDHVAVRRDELLPDLLRRVAAVGPVRHCRRTLAVLVDVGVRRDDGLAVRVLIQDAVRPRDRLVRHVHLEVEDDEVEVADREQLVVVLVQPVDRVGGELAEVAAVPVEALVSARREVLVVLGGLPVVLMSWLPTVRLLGTPFESSVAMAALAVCHSPSCSSRCSTTSPRCVTKTVLRAARVFTTHCVCAPKSGALAGLST